MQVTRSIRLTAFLIALLLVGPASASANMYIPKSHAECKAGYVTKTVTERVLKGKRPHRHVVMVKVRECVSKPVVKPVTTTAPTTAPASPAPTAVRALLDPDFTQDPGDNLKVTWTYSASADGSLPDGVLSFAVTPATGGLNPVGGCTINVGQVTTGGTCTVELQSYGAYQTTVTYTGSGNVAPSTVTATDMIEPLPVTNSYQWGTSAPTGTPSIATLLVGDTATVVVTDPNFEGATSINLADSTGAQCTATVTGITATCTMTDIATPTAYTLSYPGGVTTTASVPTADNGVQAVTDEWPPEVVQINDPVVTIQQVTILECGGGSVSAGWANTFGCPDATTANPWPVSLTVATHRPVNLEADAYGSLQDDPDPAGTVNYNVTGGALGTDYQVYNTMCGAQCGYEELEFFTPGVYVVSVTFTSADPDYADQPDGPSITIMVVN